MNSSSPGLHGLEGPGSLFSPADFADADDVRPIGAVFDIGGHGNAHPYTAAINGLLGKQMDEVKQKTIAALNLPAGWKKRLRDFLSTKNTELLDFLKVSLSSHPSLGKGEQILRKFGNPSLHPTHASIREIALDVSGVDLVAELSAELLKLREGDGLKDFVTSVRFIFERYREAGEEVLRCEAVLKGKLEVFDRIQGKLVALFDIDPTEAYAPLMESTEAYLKTVFEKHRLEDAYKQLIEAYRRFISLRDVVLMLRTVQSNENEPVCSICLAEPVQFAVSPCGHTYCMNCMRRQIGTCFFCRGQIRDKIKLFFG